MIDSKAASFRWMLDYQGTVKVGRSVCCNEASMLLLLKAMKECPNKTAALAARGILEDTTKVREIVLHAESGHQIAMEVHFYTIIPVK